MASSLDAKLTKREEFVVWFTAMLMMPNENLDHDSKERVIRCVKTAVAGGMVDDMNTSKNKELDQKLFEKKFLDMCYGPSKDDREVQKFKN